MRRILSAVAVLVTVAGVGAQAPIDLDRVGPAVGATAPDFTLPDHTGVPRSLGALLGPKGGLLVFSRSADW